VAAHSGYGHDAILERLAERLQDRARKLGELVEKKNPAMCECAEMSLEGVRS
jgi:hypothetical protein